MCISGDITVSIAVTMNVHTSIAIVHQPDVGPGSAGGEISMYVIAVVAHGAGRGSEWQHHLTTFGDSGTAGHSNMLA